MVEIREKYAPLIEAAIKRQAEHQPSSFRKLANKNQTGDYNYLKVPASDQGDNTDANSFSHGQDYSDRHCGSNQLYSRDSLSSERHLGGMF